MNRLAKLQGALGVVEVLIVDNPVDLYYLTGLELSLGRVAVTKGQAFLFVDGRYFETAKQRAPCEVLLSSVETLQKTLEPFKQVGFDSQFVTVASYQTLQAQLPGKKWVPLPSPVQPLRLIKEAEEIAALKRAAVLTWRGYKHASSQLCEGVTEEEIAWAFESFCRQHGASELSFASIIAFGENSAYPHHRAGKTRLKKNQEVLIDVGAVVDHYAGDLTRVVFFGEADPEIERMYKLTRRAQRLALEAAAPGVPVGELDRIARESYGKEQELFVHGLGHGIGLETHEYPRIREGGADRNCLLQPGMVFTIEPGLYRPGLGGVRYEDMVLMTEKGGVSMYAEL